MKRMSENCLEIRNTPLLFTLPRQRSLSYSSRRCKSVDWFLYDRNLSHEEVTLKSFLDHKLKGKHCVGEEFQKLALGEKNC